MPSAIYPSLKSKRVVVTGGGSGIGAGLVEAFAAQGADTVFVDIQERESAALAQRLTAEGGKARFEKLDFTDLAALEAFFATIGPIDVLVNNAANDDRHGLQDVTPAYWDDRMAVNLRHSLFAARAVAPGMKARGGGAIINFGSISWHLGLPGLLLYEIAKAGIEGMTKALARELGPDNIRVTCVVPGNVRTPRQEKWDTPESEAEVARGQCLKTRILPQHVAALVLFLASDDAALCTGHPYWIDAGWGVTPTCVWDLAAELGEGPLWWRDALWFTDIKGCRVHRFDPALKSAQSWDAPAPVGFLVPLGNGRFIAGAKTGLLDFDPVSGGFVSICTVEPHLPGNRLNDGSVDLKGRLWFGSMDDGEANATGTLYRLTEAGPLAMDSGIVITNGPAFSPDGRILYHADTLGKAIHAFDVAEDGTLSNKRFFAVIEDGAGWPDGLTVDAEGFVWTGLFGGWAARRYAPDGRQVEEVRFPVANITKLAFGGEDLRDVYATTAWKGLDEVARHDQPLAGGVFHFRSSVPGLPQQPVKIIAR